MLKLQEIVKNYDVGDQSVTALKGIDVQFRKNEFVAILGPSGCGKTTMLNIIGGLDRYTSGDLSINGISTKQYKDADWDRYRNHSIGFVFQSYNLIPHQNVLSNVELALTLSGVGKTERRQRAKKALEQVGLGDQLHKKPNQMSGGQMQRVAIARALVNNPDILLADEPTGALDSETSLQVMDILKEVAKEKLVIMVTHNPELAEQYANRIVRLLDGKIIDDTNPYDGADEISPEKEAKQEKKKRSKTSMSFLTALSLSLNNLLTKKGRTFMTAFAGSIGIIGIALILSLSNGVQEYIDRVQKDTLSSYPLTITRQTADSSGMVESFLGVSAEGTEHGRDQVYVSSAATQMMNAMISEIKYNDMASFQSYLEEHDEELENYVSDIQYVYDLTLQIYSADTSEDPIPVNPNPLLDAYYQMLGYDMNSMGSSYSSIMNSGMSTMNIWTELMDNQELLDSQYDVIAGSWPSDMSEVVLVVDENNEISEMTLYSLGLRDPDEISDIFAKLMNGESIEAKDENFSYDDLLSMEFKVVPNSAFYSYDESTDTWVDNSRDDRYVCDLIDEGVSLKICGIIRPKEDAVATTMMGGMIGYTKELVEHISGIINESDVVKAQEADPDMDIFTGVEFVQPEDIELTMDDVYASIDALTDEEVTQMASFLILYAGNGEAELDARAMLESMDEEQLLAIFSEQAGSTAATPDEIRASIAAMNAEERAGLQQQLAAAMNIDPSLVDVDTVIAGMSDDELLAMFQTESMTVEDVYAYIDTLSEEQLTELMMGVMATREGIKMMLASVGDEETVIELFESQLAADSTDNTYAGNLNKLGVIDLEDPTSINIYPVDFDAKEYLEGFISDYNAEQVAAGNEDAEIEYTDYIGLLLSSITSIIHTISAILIAFVTISLIVSSIMIGIITYISVLERIKEIGILRAVGASKRDVGRVFKAETVIIGFVAGAIGILVTLLLCIPANIIIEHVTDIANVAHLPWEGGVVLILISVVLTLISGLIPARFAANKDPVVALRSE